MEKNKNIADTINTTDITWQFWIDRGGTFTDVIALNSAGKLYTHKLLSDSPRYHHDAAIIAIHHILNLNINSPIPSKKITAIRMETTVATNALLERKGEPTLFVTTQGFADSLRIGYQNRPQILALNIKLPSQLYKEVVEVEERISAQGDILRPINLEQLKKDLTKAYHNGFRSIAIAFMHGYRYSDHENLAAKIAKKIGFSQISVSHKTIPVMKFVSRGDTTVVDAYLSPILKRYINSIRLSLKNEPLLFMQSNGGLVSADLFQGKDSILSGPAGGVVGMIKTAQAAGFDRVIGFDMGGTSTDISHFAGEYERKYESEIAGVKLRSPMMRINTIAAGGGSIVHFENGRYRVGPDSAGANPGPASYRLNGPLTLTDCNLLLGKINPVFFPKIFGKSGNLPLDLALVKNKFITLSKQIEKETGERKRPEEIASGFLKIAVENMANAIKKISIQRGYYIKNYLLNCFGGAAGQHACLVADALNIHEIMIHPHAGVLSAYGIGIADIRAIEQKGVEAELTNKIIPRLDGIIFNLKKATTQKLLMQELEANEITFQIKIHIRYLGSDTALSIHYGTLNEMNKNFISSHKKQFGFNPKSRPLIIDSLSVEAVGHKEEHSNKKEYTPINIKTKNNHPPPKKSALIKIFTKKRWHDASLYAREDLNTHDKIIGPAIIIENNTTTVIEAEWQAKVTEQNNLILSQIKSLKKTQAIGTDVDPVMLELFNNRFMAIAEQMGVVLRNTASSVNIKERLDFSCALFNHGGELIANAPHIPIHLGSMSESVKNIYNRRKGTIKLGDVFMTNAPYNGGTHLPDVTVITPVFSPDLKNKQAPLFFVASRGHHADIGGKSPGSMPADSHSVDEEGILIDNVKVVSEGLFLEKALQSLLKNNRYPARNITQNIEDFKAQIAANTQGLKGLYDLINEFTLPVVQAYMDHVRANVSASVKLALKKQAKKHSPIGTFPYEMDGGAVIKVAYKIEKDGSALFDFSGSSPQQPTNFNAPTAVTKAAVIYVLRCLVDTDILLNGGCLEPVNIIIPENSILSPTYPSAVVAGNVETSQAIVDTLLGALNATAAAQGSCNNFTFGNSKYQYYETICGGAGAGPNFNGTSAIHTHITNTRLTDPEILEWRFPVLLESFSIRKGSGGEGKYHGGEGVIRRIRFLEAMTATILSSHRRIPPYGLSGGKPGKIGVNWVERAVDLNSEHQNIEKLTGCGSVEMRPGDVFVIETPGGGGWGKASKKN